MGSHRLTAEEAMAEARRMREAGRGVSIKPTRAVPDPKPAYEPKPGWGAADYPDDGEPTREEIAAARLREADDLQRHQPGDAADLDATTTATGATVAPTKPRRGWTWSPVGSREFFAADHRPTWLIKRLLVSGQAGVLGGAYKVLKTSIAIDMAVSLATGTPFLGHLDVYAPVRVSLLSGESGPWSLQETARRVCTARGLDPLGLDIRWQFTLPRLADPGDLDDLCEGIRRDAVKVVLLDPLYLSLLSPGVDVQASNLYQMGPLLLGVARACLDAGATPIMLHHATRPASKSREPLELGDLAFSGISEFARQWLLLSRREAFTPGDPHKLWLAAGGSCGQGGLWSLDVDEGRLDDDFGGRGWDVRLQTSSDERQQRKQVAAQKKLTEQAEATQAEDVKFLQALDGEDPAGTGASFRRVRAAAGMSQDKAEMVASRLIRAGIIEDVPGFMVSQGNTSRKAARGIRRVREE